MSQGCTVNFLTSLVIHQVSCKQKVSEVNNFSCSQNSHGPEAKMLKQVLTQE